MPSLLSLPRELRDTICTFAISRPKNAPPHIEDGNMNHLLDGRESLSKPSLSAWTGTSLIKYRPDECVANATPLLLVNHQLHDETKATLGRMGKDARSYEVDIIVLNEVYLLPTWIRVPSLTTRADTVTANFRIAGSFGNGADGPNERHKGYEGFRGGDGAPPAMLWVLYSVLERFLKVGPTGRRKGDEAIIVPIKTLDMNVETPSYISPDRFGPPKSSSMADFLLERRGYTRNLEDHVLDPEYFTKFIAGSVESMFGMSYHRASYGTMFYEHLDNVILRKDGEVRYKWDVPELFRDVAFTDSFNRNEHKFNEWKESARMTRRSLGLTIIGD